MPEKKKKSNAGIGILIGLSVILLGVNGAQYYMNSEKDKEQESQISTQAEEIEAKTAEVVAKTSKVNQLITDLESVKAELEANGEDITELNSKIDALKRQKNYYARNFMKPEARKAMDSKIVGYEALLNDQNEKIRQLKAQNDSLYKESIVLKEAIVLKNDTISSLEKQNTDKENELSKARSLHANGFDVTAIKNPDKNKVKYNTEQEYKDKDMVQTKIEFEIGANPIAFIEEKAIYVQIISPSKKVLYDSNKGGGKFTIDGEEMNYSIKQNIMYNRKDQSLDLVFDKPKEFTSGKHKIVVWCEGHKIGEGSFRIL